MSDWQYGDILEAGPNACVMFVGREAKPSMDSDRNPVFWGFKGIYLFPPEEAGTVAILGGHPGMKFNVWRKKRE